MDHMDMPRLRVLMVDDDEDDFIITRSLLAQVKIAQYDVEWAATYAAALRAIEERRHDVYLVDYRLGWYDGLDLLREGLAQNGSAPFILLTGQGAYETDLAAMQAGAADYLVKGELTASLLERAIRYALERRRAAAALQESEARYRSLIETSPDSITLTGPDLRVLFTNEQAARMHGYGSVAEMVGLHALDLIAPEDRQRALDNARRTLEEGAVRGIEYRVLRKDGTRFPAELSASVVRDAEGRPAAFVGVVRDITERKRIEEAERDQQRLAEALRDAALSLTGTLDLDQILERILESVVRVAPYDAANIMLLEGGMARVVRSLGYAEGGLRDSIDALRVPVADIVGFRTMIETGQPSIVSDVNACPDWVELVPAHWRRSWVGMPILCWGEVLGFLNLDSATAHFFTQAHAERLQILAHQVGIAIETARLHARVQQHAAELEQRVAERTAELQAANEKLKELDRLKSQFVANVSHELRTPLTNIKTSLWLLERGKAEKRVQYMTTLNREAELLHRLIEELLDLSQLDQGKTRFARARVDVNQLVSMLVQDRSALLADRGLTLQVDAEPDLPPILGDEQKLGQVLTNLMTNAMNYTPRGGAMTVRTHALQSDGQAWTIFSVSDTGVGILPEDLPRLFERFYRGEAARQTGAGGTGLGLAICQEIVQRHGGRITVESQVGQGSTFMVWLPVAPDITGEEQP